MRSILLFVMLMCAVPQWEASELPIATPAAVAADYRTDAQSAETKGMVQATRTEKQATAENGHWYTDVGSAALVAGVAAAAVLSKLDLPPALMALLGPWGSLASLILKLAQSLLEPAAARAARQLQEKHATAFQSIATVIQTTSNDATLADLKARLEKHIPSDARPYVDAFVADMAKRGINHDIPENEPGLDVVAGNSG